MKNVVIIGGGTGTSTLLSGLRQFPTNNAVIVSSADDGGSTGVLRKELGVMPPGDIRQCLLGLSYTERSLQALFSYRFHEGTLDGHNAGNIILSALEKALGSNEEAIKTAAKILNVRGQVVPMTTYPTVLSATLQNGRVITGEHNIDEPPPHLSSPTSGEGLPARRSLGAGGREGVRSPIKNLSLKPGGPANPRALRLIKAADAIIFGPGDLFTSTIPNLLPKGMKGAIARSNGKTIMISNIMTKYGQTDGFTVSESVKTLQSYLGKKLDFVIVNTRKPNAETLKVYKKQKSSIMIADIPKIKALGVRAVARDLLSRKQIPKVAGDGLKRSIVRHDSKKLAKIIYQLVS